jgi:hypothetical protein
MTGDDKDNDDFQPLPAPPKDAPKPEERLAAKEEECTLLAASLRKAEAERDAFREALRPFAGAARVARETGVGIGARYCEWEHFARAAELVKEP